ncbi:DUF4190 domain-containing protein [Glycomyces dulcitolivorans]|uniref:DUF4190 domain-containing protein n=1 Tax=Glycomyces dulcitolivorans TaxID=2200759 RepID=UPI000DD3341A|nr:DUF4190 domain-containing protein [Glycomyces dulcitolivorans]
MSDPTFSDPEINRAPADDTASQPQTAALYPPPPTYYQPPPPVPVGPVGPSNGMGLTALILGISGLAVSWIPVLGCLGLIAGIIAIVFGALGIGKANRGAATNRSSAVAGLATGIAAVIVGLVAAVAFGSFDVPESSDTEAGQDERAAAEDEAEAGEGDAAPAEEEEVEEPAGIGDGQWEVGAEIEPGTYVTWADNSFGCYVARLAGFSGELDDIISNTNLDSDARGRITIADDDAGVEFSGGCEWVPATEETLAPPSEEIGAGIWEVGTEIQPGTYTTQAPGDGILDSCYVARLDGFSLDLDDIIANDNIDGGAQGRIEIADSDTGVEFSGDCVWTLE